MKRQTEVSCVGEVIVDFVSTKAGATLSQTPGFLKHAGGAAANVAVGLSRFGVRTAFHGKVGRDPFGSFLIRELGESGVDTSGIRTDGSRRTRLAFVSRTTSGERDFAFWENHPADERLEPRDVDFKRIARSRIVHLGSFPLLREPARSTIIGIARKAASAGVAVSFDPNIRLSLWKSRREARGVLLTMVKLSSILRLNDAEAHLLTGTRNTNRAARELLGLGPVIVVITAGRKGCYAFTRRTSLFSPGFRVRAVDTTGCGDSFLAALLFGILRNASAAGDLPASALEPICRFANAAGALTATRFGVISALPSRSEVESFLQSRRHETT
jgi:sugar/nucleoside kinase (ribokinase family)